MARISAVGAILHAASGDTDTWTLPHASVERIRRASDLSHKSYRTDLRMYINSGSESETMIEDDIASLYHDFYENIRASLVLFAAEASLFGSIKYIMYESNIPRINLLLPRERCINIGDADSSRAILIA
jgi:hypothetical protein